MNYILKILKKPGKARRNQVERTPTTNIFLIQVICNMNAKARHGTKMYEQ